MTVNVGRGYLLLLSVVGVSIAWASILSMPYSILAGALRLFNSRPEILAALVFGKIMETFLTNESALVQRLGGNNRLTAVVIGGISLAVAAAFCTIVTEPAESSV